jgi:hypothetical protein
MGTAMARKERWVLRMRIRYGKTFGSLSMMAYTLGYIQ